MAQPQGPTLPGGVLCAWLRGRARAVTSASHCGLPKPEHPSHLRERGTWSPSAFTFLYSSRSVGRQPSTGWSEWGVSAAAWISAVYSRGTCLRTQAVTMLGNCVAFSEKISPGVYFLEANQRTTSIFGVRKLHLTNYGSPRRQLDGVRTSVLSCGA